MYKALLAVALFVAAAHVSTCQNYGPPLTSSYLKFKNGSFKILQIADIHYQNGSTTPCQDILPSQLPCSDINSTDWMTQLLALEKPDLVVYTGDNIVYDGTHNISAAQRAVLKPTQDAGIPYMVTYGNHDCESEPCRANLTAVANENSLSLTKVGPSDVHGYVNYAYTVEGSDGKPKFALYVMDGGAYYTVNNYSGYDFIWPSQVQWYNLTSIALEKAQGQKVPGIAFFHIPLPEYDIAWACANPSVVADNSANPSYRDFGNYTTESGAGLFVGADSKDQLSSCLALANTSTGVHQEGVYSGRVNGGLFSAFAERGDVKMANVGHDHLNDYCATVLGVRLCYSGGFGYHAYGKAGWPRRSRIIELQEDGSIKTWKRLDSWGNYSIIDTETFRYPLF